MTVLSTNTTAPRRPLYPIYIPAKFSPEGAIQQFPGNTTFCHVPVEPPLLPNALKFNDSSAVGQHVPPARQQNPGEHFSPTE